MLNGFWTVVFSADTDIGAGVVTIQNGKVLGGDTSFTYLGAMESTNNGGITGELQINRHSKFLPSVIPNLENYTLLISGKSSNDHLDLIGKVKGQESIQMTIKGKKVASI